MQGTARFVEVLGLRLCVREWGEGGTLPILALHGWLDNSESFAPLAAHWPGQRIIALEWPGHGLSEHLPASADYHLYNALPLLDALLDRLGLRQVALLGHSLGGVVALIFAIARPQRVERLLLIDALGPRTEPPELAGGRLAEALRHHTAIARHGVRRMQGLEQALAQRAQYGLLPGVDAVARALLSRALRPVEGGVVWRHDPRLTLPSPYYHTEEQVLAQLRALTVPGLLLLPSEGLVKSRAYLPERLAASGLACVELPGGHYLHTDAPEACVVALARACGVSVT